MLRGSAALGAFLWALSCASREPLPPPALPLVVTEDAPFRARPPSLGPEEAESGIQTPEVRAGVLANGLTLWVVNRPQVPYVALSFVAQRAGTLERGVAPEVMQLMSRAVVEGGTIWSDGKHVQPPTLSGRGVSFYVLPTHSQFFLQVIRPNLVAGFGLLARTLRFPSFADGNLDPVRLSELNDLQGSSSSVNSLLLKQTLESEFGAELAERLVVSDFDRVRSADLAALRECYRAAVNPNTGAIIAVGDVTFEAIQELAQRDLGAWPAWQAPPAATPPEPFDPQSTRRRSHLLIQGESGQAYVLLLQPAPPASAEADELPFALLAEIAVGSFRSRANTRLRHDAGLTYGVHPRMLRAPGLGLLTVSAAFSSDQVSDSILTLLNTLEGLQTGLVSARELTEAKVALGADLERTFGNNAALASFLGKRFAEGKSLEWLVAYPSTLAAVTAADVRRVALKYLRPDAVEIGVAGSVELHDALRSIGEVDLYGAYSE